MQTVGARLTSSSVRCRVEKHPDSRQTHEYVLDVLVVLVLRNNLLPKIHLLFNKPLLILSIRVVMVPVNGCASELDACPLTVGLPYLQGVHDRFNPFFPQLLFSSYSPSLPADHSLLIFLSHVFFVCD